MVRKVVVIDQKITFAERVRLRKIRTQMSIIMLGPSYNQVMTPAEQRQFKETLEMVDKFLKEH